MNFGETLFFLSFYEFVLNFGCMSSLGSRKLFQIMDLLNDGYVSCLNIESWEQENTFLLICGLFEFENEV